jgi:hypothetical protein
MHPLGVRTLAVFSGPSQSQLNIFSPRVQKVLQEADSRHEHAQRKHIQRVSRQVAIWEHTCVVKIRKVSTLKFNIGAIGFPEPRALWTRLCRRQDPWALMQRFASTSTPRPGRISEIMSESRPTKWDMTQENLLCMLSIPRLGDRSLILEPR